MFVHLVLIKLKPGVTRADPRVPAWQAKFAALEHKCPGIVRFEHGWNIDRPARSPTTSASTWRSRRAPTSMPTARIRTHQEVVVGAARDRRVGDLRL